MSGQTATRSRILNILQVVVSLIGLTVIVLTQDVAHAVHTLAGMAWLPFLIALLGILGGHLVRAYRWGLLAWALDMRVRWRCLAALYFVGAFFSLFLPTGVGGDAVKMYELSRQGHKTAAAISSVLVDRFLGLFVLFAIALLALIASPELAGPQVWFIVGPVFIASLISVALLVQRTWIESWGQRLGLGGVLGQIKILRELYESLHLYSAGALLKATAIAVVWNLILILAYHLLGRAVGIDLSAWYYLLLVPVISILELIPSLGGLGIREGATVLLFGQLGVAQTQALALALAYDLILVSAGFVGALVYLTQGIQRMRSAVE
jgi:uncharacterized protein (TIRG00374 family)